MIFIAIKITELHYFEASNRFKVSACCTVDNRLLFCIAYMQVEAIVAEKAILIIKLFNKL